MSHRQAPQGYRVLVTAPFGRDAESVAALLRKSGYSVEICADLNAVADRLDDDTGAILLTEEALLGELSPLAGALAAQQPWSDIPFIVLAARQTGPHRRSDAVRLRLPEAAINVITLERPLGSDSLLSATASAMRARQKQFEMRDRLADLDESRAALAASEAELRLVADSLPVLISFVDAQGHYRFANRAYESWLGRRPEDVVGRHISEVLGEKDYASRKPAIDRALAGETMEFEASWPTPDGERREADIRYLSRRTADGRPDGFHIFVADITERKRGLEILEQRVAERTAALQNEVANRAQAEAQLRQSQKMEAVGQLTGGIAHDFNNMLTGVIGGLDIIKRRLATGRTEDLDRFMDAASTSAQRAAALTQRLLAFARRQSLDTQSTDVNALVGSLDDLLRRTIGEDISLLIIQADRLSAAVTDANQLESAILNLAINARDAMPAGGTLTIETGMAEVTDESAAARGLAPGRYVTVAVSDTGVGMPPEILDKVYEPFFTTKPVGQGTGLGLSMVYGFARQSGGQVRIHSAVGEGTSVRIFLPVAVETDIPAEVAPAAAVPQGGGQTVLLVEDDESVRLLVQEVLDELGYHAVEAAEPQAAIEILASDTRIDLMVSDVGLPGMNGRQLAEIAREHRAGLPILFVTGYAENAAIRAGFLGTNMAMITKPFSIDTLAAKISEMLGADVQSETA